MLKVVLLPLIALVLVVTFATGAIGVGDRQAEPPSSASSDLKVALDTALDDERQAVAFYSAVMAMHGERPPFSQIIGAERRHEGALLAQYRRLGLTPPPDRWAATAISVPSSFAESCDRAIVSEVRNAAMYARLITDVGDPSVRAVFENLRRASIERHLPAFRRHGSGWAPVADDALTEAQRRQQQAALAARDAMFGTLFSELATAMADGDAASSIAVCRSKASEIAARVAAERNVGIGRTSWKLRNTANTPPVWAELPLDERPERPTLLADRAGRLGVIAPIRLLSMCIQCHGRADELAPGVADAIERLYPDDEATGFAEGDLRGWFWIEVPAPPAE